MVLACCSLSLVLAPRCPVYLRFSACRSRLRSVLAVSVMAFCLRSLAAGLCLSSSPAALVLAARASSAPSTCGFSACCSCLRVPCLLCSAFALASPRYLRFSACRLRGRWLCLLPRPGVSLGLRFRGLRSLRGLRAFFASSGLLVRSLACLLSWSGLCFCDLCVTANTLSRICDRVFVLCAVVCTIIGCCAVFAFRRSVD